MDRQKKSNPRKTSSQKPRHVTDSTHNVSSSGSKDRGNTSAKGNSAGSQHTTSSKNITSSTNTNQPTWHRRLEVTTSTEGRLPSSKRPIPVPVELPRARPKNPPAEDRTRRSENPPRQRARQRQQFEDQSGTAAHRNRAGSSTPSESPETSVCSTISNIDHNNYGLRNPDNKIVFICYLCSMYLPTKDDVLNHLRRVHGSSEDSVNRLDVNIYSRLHHILPP